ncbi:MAG: hypothetical protein ACOYU5_02435 [Stygiobacter sp.]
MKSFVKLTVILSIVTIINSCNHSTEPEPQPGRRDYTWTVDTINPGKEFLYLGNMWGSNASDVWAVGASSWSATSIWHYNGIKWSCDSIPRSVDPSAIFGFSSNNLWLGNNNSKIWHYNGIEWQKFGEYKIEGFNNVIINHFDGNKWNNIYGVGGVDNSNTYKAIIMKFNGNNWQFMNIPDTKVGFETVAVENNSGVLVISGTVYDPQGFVGKIYSWDGKVLKELLSGYWLPFITKIDNEIFATFHSKIYKYSNKQLTLWKDNTGTGINGNIICGRNKNDFFIVASNGIAHYNGTDFKTLYSIESEHQIEIGIGSIFEKDVFFIAVDFTTGKNLIIHGKLK